MDEKKEMPSENVFSHKSVMLQECIEGLSIDPNGIYVDGTAGGGGHSFEISSKLQNGRLIAIDRDDAAIEAAGKKLACFEGKVNLVRNNFSNIKSVCNTLGIDKINGVLLDLGVSSYQLDTAERGFSYNADALLDMRMDRRSTLSAFEVVNNYSEERLRQIIFEYGEERFARNIVRKICERRQSHPIETTGELVEIIKSAIPAASRENGHHPAKRTFQAIRIEVNGELDAIAPAINDAVEMLDKGGRIAVITFHSLEDRIVKQAFAKLAQGCVCPKDFPVCVCGKKPTVNVITRKPILPSKLELEENPRSRSAKLRIAEKI